MLSRCPISGYLFILVTEILALMMERGNIRPFRTKNKIEHLLDIYADDLTVCLEFDRRNNWRNRENVRRVLEVIEKFYSWSGLKINLGKTYVTFFWQRNQQTLVCGGTQDQMVQ